MSSPELIQWSKVKILSMNTNTNQENVRTENILHCIESIETIFLAPYPTSFKDAEQFCAALNGFLPLPRNLSHIKEIFANRDLSNNTWHSREGSTKCYMNFFASVNLDFGRGKSILRARLGF